MAFWQDEQCPGRGYALGHVHDPYCDPANGGHRGTGVVHAWTDCCYCGVNATDYQARAKQQAVPQLDVDQRLRELGLVPANTPETTGEHEPKMATGIPTGKYDGKGRGPLTDAQKGYLTAIAAQLGDRR